MLLRHEAIQAPGDSACSWVCLPARAAGGARAAAAAGARETERIGRWHLWEDLNGALRPLLPDMPVRAECEQLWVRRDAGSPWRMEFLIDRVSTAEEWVFKRDQSVRLPWSRVVRVIDGIGYLGPEAALLFKAKQDREKDRDDLAAARR